MNQYVIFTLVSGITGLLSGILGAGPEVLIVPLLTAFGSMKSIKHRIGTSLFMLLPPIGLFAAMKYYQNGFVDVKAALYMSLIFTLFASVSAEKAIDINSDNLQKVFAVFTIGIGIYYLFK